MRVYDEEWVRTVCAAVDPVLLGAGVGFTPGRGSGGTILWEAEPDLFLARYPDCGLVESYGGQARWEEARCLDYWVHAEPEERRLRVAVEGWNLPDFYLDARIDWHGFDVAQMLARILGLDPPVHP